MSAAARAFEALLDDDNDDDDDDDDDDDAGGGGVAYHRVEVLNGGTCVPNTLVLEGIGIVAMHPATVDGRPASIAHICAIRTSGEPRWIPIGVRRAHAIAVSLTADDVAAANDAVFIVAAIIL